MDLSRIDTAIGLVSLAFLCAAFVVSSISSPLGALSLPSMTVLTSLIYFYLMPVVVLSGGDQGFFGMYIGDLAWAHTAVLLYAIGAIAACAANRRVLNANPALSYPWDRQFNKKIYLLLWAIAIGGTIAQWAMGKLNVTGDSGYNFAAEEVGNLAFITQSYNLLITLTLVLLIRDRFRWRSLLVLALVLAVFLQIGFRFRLVLLLAAVATSFALQRNTKIGMIRGLVGTGVAIPVLILLGGLRRYGQGIDLSALSNADQADAMSGGFGGEFSLVYSADYVTSHALPPPCYWDPWIVAIARLVPSFLWHDKPMPTYLEAIISGASVPGAERAGIAAPQYVEILLQFGWWGLVPLAFLYFLIAAWLVKRFAYRGYEVRMAGCSLIPSFFGYYMQTRGYFFQLLADGLFILGPLFLMNIGMKRTGSVPRPQRRSRPHFGEFSNEQAASDYKQDISIPSKLE